MYRDMYTDIDSYILHYLTVSLIGLNKTQLIKKYPVVLSLVLDS